MKRKSTLYSSLMFASVLFGVVGCNKQGEEKKTDSRQKDEEVERFEKNVGNKREYSTQFFENPNNRYRPLAINNDSPLSPYGCSTSAIDLYQEHGYGGVVTNVAWGENYLTSPAAWELLEEVVSYAIDEKDMRVMLYDEDIYPSGGARQLTLKATPEGENWEAQGLVRQLIPCTKDVLVNLPSLHGHTLLLSYFYPGTNTGRLVVNDPKLLDLEAGGTYLPTENGYLALLFHKQFYEGTHFQYNLLESRRYIDLLNPAPIQEFLRNTYDAYYEHLGKYFGKGIEATFMDEPSMPGFYFTPTTAAEIDPVDPEIPQLPAVNYSGTLKEKFLEKYGYDMDPYLPYLFEQGDSSDEVRRFRWDYHSLLGELVNRNLVGQIHDWAKEHNVVSSGHFLVEEDLSGNALLAGNYLQNFHAQGMPGMDITKGDVASAITIGAVTAKEVSSAADFDGKFDAFAEIGQDQGAGANVDENIANVAIIQSMGINYLTSYYRYRDEEEDKKFANTLARINYMLHGNASDKSVGVYLPMESIYAGTTPYNSNGSRIYTGQWGFNSTTTEINENYNNLLATLVHNQVDYHIFDSLDLSKCEIKDGAIFTPNGERFSSFIVPSANAMDLVAAKKLKEAKEAGVKIYLHRNNHWLAQNPEEQAELDLLYDDLQGNAITGDHNIMVSTLIHDLPESKKVDFSPKNPSIVARKQTNENNTLYMLVNANSKPASFTLNAPEVGEEYRSWDPYSGKVNGMAVKVDEEGSHLRIELPAYGIGLYTIE